jgi:hypothetical protein
MYHQVAAQSHFMTVWVVDAQSHVQRLVAVVKMVTVLEECTTKEQRSTVRSLWAKRLNTNDICKEMFCVYGEVYVS